MLGCRSSAGDLRKRKFWQLLIRYSVCSICR
jgi:hypothetical protein